MCNPANSLRCLLYKGGCEQGIACEGETCKQRTVPKAQGEKNGRKADSGRRNRDVFKEQLLAQCITFVCHKYVFMNLWLFCTLNAEPSSLIVMLPTCGKPMTAIYLQSTESLTVSSSSVRLHCSRSLLVFTEKALISIIQISQGFA